MRDAPRSERADALETPTRPTVARRRGTLLLALATCAALLSGLLGQSAFAETNKAPAITKQTTPSGITIVEEGQSVSWEATASGVPAPTVKWEVSTDGGKTYTPITGATSTKYTIASATTSESGHKFRATFTNIVKSISSAPVTLTVRKKPAITLQPISTTVEEGQNATFEAAASGFPAPSVQWEYSSDSGLTWTNAPTGTSTKLTVTGTKTTFNGREYRATFSNLAGEAITEIVTLTVHKAPAVTKSPAAAIAEEGHSASFEASASGFPAPSVQWELSTNGGSSWSPIGSATSTTYTNASVTTGETGYEYRAVFTNAAGTATSAAATLTVRNIPQVTKQPSSQNLEEGQPATFEATASGFPAPSEQWEVSTNGGSTWTPIGGANSTTYTIASVKTTENAHLFRATFTNAAGSATSTGATLTVYKPPAVTKQPASTTAIEGANATFEATASGFPAPSVQWELSTNGGGTWGPIGGATSTKLTVTAVTLAQSGYEYRAVFTNTGGTATSNAATLTVYVPPVLVTQPQSTTVEQGTSAVFEAQASGVPAPTVQWERSTDAAKTWSPIAGQTAEQLTVPSTKVSESGYEYRAVFTNAAGKATSAAAVLTVATSHYTTVGWGENVFRQLGDGTNVTPHSSPVPSVGLHFVTAIAAGGTHSLALVANGSVYSWGHNEFGQLGNGSTLVGEVPAVVPGLGPAKAIAAGLNFSLALLTNGTVMAWGNGEAGQLGNGTTKELNEVPVAVKGLTGVRAISAGSDFALALLNNGTVMAWGADDEGQLGNGTTKELSNVPVAVTGLSGVTSISAGGSFGLAALGNGSVKGWGSDSSGVLDNEAVEEFSNKPVTVGALAGVSTVSAGFNHALALLSTGTVLAWGQDNYGQLGIGVIQPRQETPTPVSGLSGISAISAGTNDSAAVLASGGVLTWGINAQGTLGIGTTGAPSDVPVTVPGLSKMAGVSAGGTFTLAYGEPLPSVSSITPQLGSHAGGTHVTIKGSTLTGATSVQFGANAASEVKVVSSTEVTATAPAGAGTVDVTVTSESGTSPSVAGDRFTYQLPATVTKLSVPTGSSAGGTPVTITGTDFTGATSVTFGGVPAEFKVVSPTTITATTPAHEAGTFDILITNTAGPSAPSGKDRFKYLPTITALAPATGPAAGETSVTVTGTGFATAPGASAFKFGAVKSKSASCSSATTCTVIAPPGAVGTVDVTVTVGKAVSTTSPADQYVYS